MEPLSRKRPKKKDDTEAKKVCHRMHDIRSFLHKAGNQSTPPTSVSRHDTQPLLVIAACNGEAVIAPASELQSKTQSSSIPLALSETSDDANTSLEVNHEAEVLIAAVLPANDVGLVKVGTVLPSNVLDL